MNEEERPKGKAFQVDELDDTALEDAAGGIDVNVASCGAINSSGCNVVAGCGATSPTTKITPTTAT